MPKGASKKRGRSSGGGGNPTWSGVDHAVHAEERRRKRLKKKQKKEGKAAASDDNNNADDSSVVAPTTAATTTANRLSERERRRQAATHETAEKREAIRLKLHLTKTKRELAALKERLERWDPQEEAQKEAKRQQEEEAKRQQEEEANHNNSKKKKKRYQRKGPETWKLKGAARPAHLVYDFDTRYVDPLMEAHKQAEAKAQRSQNVLAIYKGRAGQHDPKEEEGRTAMPLLQQQLREYLSLLMQLGHLSLEANQFKSARSAWLECMDLEGDTNPVTTARESLMRLYLQLGRREAALRLGGERLKEDASVVIRFSTALVAIAEKPNDWEEHLVSAIKSNPFCAYYLAFHDTFSHVMEYTDDIGNSDEEPQSSLEEAIEYCASDQAASWKGEPGSVLRKVVIQAAMGQHNHLSRSDLQWEGRLASIEKDCLSRHPPVGSAEEDAIGSNEHDGDCGDEGIGKTAEDEEEEASHGDDEDQDDDDDNTPEEPPQSSPVDVTMFIGMFRTAMDMVKEEGHF